MRYAGTSVYIQPLPDQTKVPSGKGWPVDLLTTSGPGVRVSSVSAPTTSALSCPCPPSGVRVCA
jgi:hypothetical protein